jgi:integrase
MAVEKVGVYRRWLEPVPKVDGKPVPKSQWPRKRRHSWTVRWYGTTGKRYSKDFRTKKLADQCARDLQDQVKHGKQDRPEKITLHEFIQEHAEVMKGQVAYATLVDQLRALRFFEKYISGSTLLQRVRPSQAEGFVAHRLASGVAVGTANKDIRTLKRIFNLAIDPRRYLAEGQNPFGRIKQRKKAAKSVRYVSVKEYRSLMEATESRWWQGVMSLAYGSGLRKGEILNLTWADIDFESQQVYIRAKGSTKDTIEWEPKDHENRVVPMSDETAQLLANRQADSEEGLPYIFISPQRFQRIKQRMREHRWNARSEIVNNTVKNFEVIRCKAGVVKCSVHDLRRSAITNWAQKLPIQVVQQFAGHSNISTTRKYYLAVRSEDITSANKVMNEILEDVRTD